MNAKGSYLILNVTVKNNGTKAITVSDSDFKLVKDKTEYKTCLLYTSRCISETEV